MATPDRLPADLRARYIDELTGELARRLLQKQEDLGAVPCPVQHGRPPSRNPVIRVDSPGAARTGRGRRWLGWAGRRRN